MYRFGYRIICLIVLIFGLILVSSKTHATQYTVRTDEEFNALTLAPGDVVTWLDGTYTDQEINWSGQQGTAENPIILKAESPGGVIFTGSSTVNIYGNHLIIDGFYWKEGQGENNHIQFRKNGSNSEFGNNCTIRNCAFDNLYTPEPDKSRWVVLYGSNNVVENCSFLNKESAGALILVELSYSQNITPGHIIRNNYFYNVSPKDNFVSNSNDCETIRIGASSYQATSAQVVVEGNYFQKTDGENEIISNKSADNSYRHNTFRNCRGSLVLRHGARAHVEGNYFLGEGKEKSGGVRISDRDHVIINNYMQELNNDGDKWNNAITLVGGGTSSGGTNNGYQNVDNVIIAHNTIYDCDGPIFYNDRNAYNPTGVIAFNLVYSEKGNIVSGDITGTGKSIKYEGNIFGGSNIGISVVGIVEGNAGFSEYGETFRPSSTGIAANAAGSSYNNLVNIDVEGQIRPNSDLDVGAHEVLGATGSIKHRPIMDGDVGISIGACFIGASGTVLTECGLVADFLIASQNLDFDEDGGTISSSISSNVDWTVTDNQDWIFVTPNSGTGNGTIDITVLANTNTSERIGTVTLSGTGVDDEFITITQAGLGSIIEVTGVRLTPDSLTIGTAGSAEFKVIVSPSNATNPDFRFKSDNTAVATVDENGVVTAESEGSTIITVTTEDGNFTDSSKINVIANATGTNWALGQPVTGTGTVDDTNISSNLVDGDVVSRWSVSGFPQSATVDLGGDITINQIELVCYENRAYQFVVEGSLTENGIYSMIVDHTTNSIPGTPTAPIISVVDDVEARFVKITVTSADVYSGPWVSLTELRVFGTGERDEVPVSGVDMDLTSVELLEGETQQLVATISPSNATNKLLSFSSSDVTIASVDDFGLVTALSKGSAVISVTTDDGGFNSSTEITVLSTVLRVNEVIRNKIVLSPNPFNQSLMIQSEVPIQDIKLFNTAGARIPIARETPVSGISQLRTDHLPSGMYILHVSYENHATQEFKVIKK